MMRDDKAWIMNHEKFVFEKDKGAVYACPFGAITIE